MKVTSNFQPRDVLDAFSLTKEEEKEFDYLDWEALEKGQDSASFFRYKGEVYDLGEFERIPTFHNPEWDKWDGYQSDTFFSGILVKYTDAGEGVIVGRYYE